MVVTEWYKHLIRSMLDFLHLKPYSIFCSLNLVDQKTEVYLKIKAVILRDIYVRLCNVSTVYGTYVITRIRVYTRVWIC